MLECVSLILFIIFALHVTSIQGLPSSNLRSQQPMVHLLTNSCFLSWKEYGQHPWVHSAIWKLPSISRSVRISQDSHFWGCKPLPTLNGVNLRTDKYWNDICDRVRKRGGKILIPMKGLGREDNSQWVGITKTLGICKGGVGHRMGGNEPARGEGVRISLFSCCYEGIPKTG